MNCTFYCYFKSFFCLILIISWGTANTQTLWTKEKKQKIDSICANGLTESLIVWSNNELVYSYGDTTETFNIFSIRKSLTSLLLGICQDEGLVDLNSTLASLNITEINGLTLEEKQATVYDLLKSKSGVYHAAAFETPGMENKRPERGSHPPGAHWFYNNWDFNALISILETATSKPILEYFNRKIVIPLKLDDFNKQEQQYIKEENTSIHPAILWRLSSRDLLKIGTLMLNNGNYKGVQVVSKEWIRKSTRSYSDLGILGGYGLCWWVATNGEHFPFFSASDQTFSARGTGQQILLIIPSTNTIIVHLTKVESPNDKIMKVTAFGRLLNLIMKS